MNKKSFLEWVISNNNGKIKGFTNHMWNGITCLEYCKVIEQIINNNLFWTGVRHIYSPTPKSKYDMAVIISKVFNLQIEIVPIEANEALDKTLSSNCNDEEMFSISELNIQINEVKNYELL